MLQTIIDSVTHVSVQLEWNGWQSADVRVDDLENVHWWQPPGAPCALLHAYVSCAKLQPVERAGSTAANDSLQQRLLVCVLKSHTPPATYSALVSRSAPRYGKASSTES